MGEPVVRNPVFDSLENELDILDKKISSFSFNDLEATAEMPTITLGEMETKASIDNSKFDFVYDNTYKDTEILNFASRVLKRV